MWDWYQLAVANKPISLFFFFFLLLLLFSLPVQQTISCLLCFSSFFPLNEIKIASQIHPEHDFSVLFQAWKKKKGEREKIFFTLHVTMHVWCEFQWISFLGIFFLLSLSLSAHLLALLCLFLPSPLLFLHFTLFQYTQSLRATAFDTIWNSWQYFLLWIWIFFSSYSLCLFLLSLSLSLSLFLFLFSLCPFICLNLYLSLSVDIWLSEKEVKVYLSQEENGVCEDCISGCESHFTFSVHESRDKLTQFF